jgi:hypothetical protein
VNYRRRLLLAWILFSVCWIGYWGWRYGSHCSLDRFGGPSGGSRAVSCHWTRIVDGAPTVVGQTAPLWTMGRDMVITTFGAPLWAIVAGVIVYWAVMAFERRSRYR